MPNDTFDCAYTVYPLQTGYCSLPAFHVKFNHTDQVIDTTTSIEYLDIDSVIQNMLSTEIFILPKDYKLLNDENFNIPEIMPSKKK
jgi:hypothetical protein